MKGSIKDLKRRIHYELSCINTTLAIIMAAGCVLLGILFAIGGVDGDLYEEWNIPLCAFSPFFMVLFWIIAYAVFGASCAIAISTPYNRNGAAKTRSIILFACTLVLCYSWIPIVYKAASLLLGTLLAAVIIICLAILFSMFVRMNRIAAWGVFAFAAWMLYILYYTFALFLLN